MLNLADKNFKAAIQATKRNYAQLKRQNDSTNGKSQQGVEN